ncbi:MAG: hypothetical protein IPO99_19480 [Nitrospira sp.]|nr:hypothetical protein [Nitrospira sp.]
MYKPVNKREKGVATFHHMPQDQATRPPVDLTSKVVGERGGLRATFARFRATQIQVVKSIDVIALQPTTVLPKISPAVAARGLRQRQKENCFSAGKGPVDEQKIPLRCAQRLQVCGRRA